MIRTAIACMFLAASQLTHPVLADDQKPRKLPPGFVAAQLREDVAASIKEFFQHSEETRLSLIANSKDHLANTKIELARAQRGKIDPNARGKNSSRDSVTYPSRQDKESDIKKIKEDISETTDRMGRLLRDTTFAPRFENQLEVGMIGSFSYPAKVVSVLSDSEALIETNIDVFKTQTVRTPFVDGDGRVVHVGVPTDAWSSEKKVICLKRPTNGLVDDNQLALDGAFQITGTMQYESMSGVATVFILEPIDLSQFLEQTAQAP